jgi:hypothetical protein
VRLVYFRFMNWAWKRLVLLVLVALIVPASALADTTSTTTTTTPIPVIPPPSKPKPVKPKPAKPKPAPAAKGSVSLFLPSVFVVNKQPVTIPGRGVQFHGIVRPFVPGQWAVIKATSSGKLIKRYRLRIKPSKNHSYGEFSQRVVTNSVGTVTLAVSHDRTPQQVGFTTARTFNALDTHVGPGSTGPFVQLVQQRLLALHFYLPPSGRYDSFTELAVDAYHRLLGWGTYTTLDGRTISYLLNGWGEFKVRFPSHGRHAEGNLTHQLLALTDGSKVQWIFPISSGKPSTPTILGDFRIYQRTPGYLPDGMYYSSFFIRGYAIHGYDPAPDYPASHGCMRLPIQDAITVYNWLGYGDWVDVYYQ